MSKIKYLTCNAYATNNSVHLLSEDEGNVGTRWYIGPSSGMFGSRSIYSVPRSSEGKYMTIQPKDIFAVKSTQPIIKQSNTLFMMDYTGSLVQVPNTNSYKIIHNYFDPKDISKTKSLMLQCGYRTDTNLSYGNDLESTFGYWTISPVGEYSIVEIKYIQTGTDKSVLNTTYGAFRYLQNPSSSTVIQKITLSEKVTESSLFREPQDISLKTYGQVSGPAHDTNGNLNTTSEGKLSTLEFGKSTAEETTISDEISVTIPPYTNVNIQVVKYTYDVTDTYIATVKSKLYGLKFRIKGKYIGKYFSHIVAKISNADNEQIIEEKIIEKNDDHINFPIIKPAPIDTLKVIEIDKSHFGEDDEKVCVKN